MTAARDQHVDALTDRSPDQVSTATWGVRRLRRAGWAATLVVLAVAVASCAAPTAAQSSTSTTPPSTVAAASVSTSSSNSPISSTAPAPTAPRTAAGTSLSAASGYLALAKSAYPGRSSTKLVATGQAICATLRTDPSLHDAVGTLSGQIQGQGSADQLVRAAITAYCPDLSTG